jgi:hypothetical protein
MDTPSIMFRCQACGACSQNVSPNCKCTDEDRKAMIDAERRAVDAMFAELAADPRVAQYANKPIVTTHYRVITIGGDE